MRKLCALVALLVFLVPLAAEEKPPSRDPAAVALLEKALQRYRGLKTYQDKLSIGWDFEGPPELRVLGSLAPEQEGSLKVARPDRVAMKVGEGGLWCDGKTVWTRYEQLRQYTEWPLRGELDVADLAPLGLFLHPLAPALTGSPTKTVLARYPWIRDLHAPVAERRSGVEGHRVRGTLKLRYMFGASKALFSVWLDASGLVHELVLDLTEMYRLPVDSREKEKPQDQIKKAVWILRLADLRLDGEIPAGEFAFSPRTGDKQVDRIGFEGLADPEASQELVGKPAPAFAGKDLEGKPVSLAALRGKVVILQFWIVMMDVGPLPEMEKVAGRFPGQVTLIGVCSSIRSAEAEIRKQLREHKIGGPNLHDPDQKIAGQYGVRGYPATVLIDRQGLVQAVLSGHSLVPYSGEGLAHEVRLLLEGPRDLKEVAPGRLLPRQGPEVLESGAAKGWHDLDGDGKSELVLADPLGKIEIVSGGGTKVQRLKLEGGPAFAHLWDLRPVLEGKDAAWLAVWLMQQGVPDQPSRMALTAHDPSGKLRWTYRPLVPLAMSYRIECRPGDLDGDGLPEVALVLAVYKMQRAAQNIFLPGETEHFLVVLDRSGRRTHQRQLGQEAVQLHAVLPPAGPGQPGTLLCQVGSRLVRYEVQAGR